MPNGFIYNLLQDTHPNFQMECVRSVPNAHIACHMTLSND